MNFHWPAGGCSPYRPWYQIGWRCLFAPLVFTGFFLSSLGIAAMNFSIEDGLAAWRNER